MKVTAVSGPKRHSCGFFGDALTLLGLPSLQPPGGRFSGVGSADSPSASDWCSIAFRAAPSAFHAPDSPGSNPHSPQGDSHRKSVGLVLFAFLFGCWLVWLDFDTVSYYAELTGLELVM